jgi:hypothetical protein
MRVCVKQEILPEMWCRGELSRPRQCFQNSDFQCFQQLQWLQLDCQTQESTTKTSGSWVIAVGDSKAQDGSIETCEQSPCHASTDYFF